jgi:riboflavin synthase
MFTGIVERTGTVKSILPSACGRVLTIDAGPMTDGLKEGGSIAVNGCCTTAVKIAGSCFTVDLMQITLEKTNLGDLNAESPVNLERPMKLGEELSGHLVQGHVDGVGEVIKIDEEEESWVFTIKMPSDLTRYVISTGSIAMDGISLTVAYLDNDCFQVGIIPHTWNITNMHAYRVGTKVNLEVDMIGKYIEKLFPERFA